MPAPAGPRRYAWTSPGGPAGFAALTVGAAAAIHLKHQFDDVCSRLQEDRDDEAARAAASDLLDAADEAEVVPALVACLDVADAKVTPIHILNQI